MGGNDAIEKWLIHSSGVLSTSSCRRLCPDNFIYMGKKPPNKHTFQKALENYFWLRIYVNRFKYYWNTTVEILTTLVGGCSWAQKWTVQIKTYSGYEILISALAYSVHTWGLLVQHSLHWASLIGGSCHSVSAARWERSTSPQKMLLLQTRLLNWKLVPWFGQSTTFPV